LPISGAKQRDVARAATPKKHEGSGKPGPAPSPTSLHGARVRKENALADLREFEAKKRRGELLEASDVRREWESIARMVRAAMLAVPGRVRAERPDLEAEAVALIDREVRAALAGLTDAPGAS
jgi:phage terminase Nu1 subunit (DNA packaging protein)